MAKILLQLIYLISDFVSKSGEGFYSLVASPLPFRDTCNSF